MSTSINLTPSDLGRLLGRLNKGKSSERKKAASRENWKKALKALEEKRRREKEESDDREPSVEE